MLGDAEGAGTPPRPEGFFVGVRRFTGALVVVVAGVHTLIFFFIIASLCPMPFLVLQLTPVIRCLSVTRPFWAISLSVAKTFSRS